MGLCFSTPKSKAPSHAYMIDQYPRPVDDRKYEPEQQPPPYSATTPPISGRSEYHGSAAPSDSKASYEPAQSQLGPSASGSSSAPPPRSNNPFRTPETKARYIVQPYRKESRENALETLRKYNTVILVDDSGSMSHGNPSRWQQARDALAPLAEVTASYDSDGIDIFFLNNEKEGRNLKNAEQVIRLFDSVTPDGRTPIGERLDELLRDYIDLLDERARGPRERRPKPVNFIVLTDGVPTDDPESVIMNAARRLDEGRHLLNTVGIQFVQVGDDPDATAYLQSLDNDLKGVRDIVDTTPYLGGELTVDMIIKIVIGGINRRVDKEGASFLKQEFL